MAQLSESDKLLAQFEAQNGSVEYWIMVTSEGIPFKFSQSIVPDKGNNIVSESDIQSRNYSESVKISGLVSDLINYCKRVIDDLKKGNQGNIVIRLRMKDGKEYVIQQECDFFLITKQVCKTIAEPVEETK
jgi:hypothetical protein